jgi:hypothetical protein
MYASACVPPPVRANCLTAAFVPSPPVFLFCTRVAAAPAKSLGQSLAGGRPHAPVILDMRSLSPEIAKALADVRALADQFDAAASSEERCRLADLLCSKVDQTIGMIVRTDPVGTIKRQRRPSLAEISKHNLEVRVAPDGSYVIARGKPTDDQVTSPEQTPEDELERWRKKKYAR